MIRELVYRFSHFEIVGIEYVSTKEYLVKNLRQSAAKLGLNVSKFDREFLDRAYSRHVDEDIQSGEESGVTKTPTFFINGDRYNDSWDLDTLLSALDEESVFSWTQTSSSI